MTLNVLLAYVATVFVFLVSPGPSHIFMLSTSLSHGIDRSWPVGIGDLTGHVWQIAVAAVGLAGFMYVFQEFFMAIKWAGVGFLIYLGLSQILRKGGAANRSTVDTQSHTAMFWKGFLTSSSNPKAIVFFAALLPQFINPSQPTAHQYVILGVTYIIIDGCFLLFYGTFAHWIARRFEKHLDKYLNKASGSLLIVSAVLLGLKDMGEKA
jgi:threonine/homoserine/homoserine lactone efflux protein